MRFKLDQCLVKDELRRGEIDAKLSQIQTLKIDQYNRGMLTRQGNQNLGNVRVFMHHA